MSSRGDEPLGGGYLDRADGTTPAEAVRQLITAPIIAVAGGIAFLIGSMIESLSRIGMVIEAAWMFMVSLLTEPIQILEITSRASGVSIADEFGIFAFPVGVAIILLAFFLWERSGIGIPIVDQLWRR